MNFQHFAEQHGLIISDLVMNRWVRCATVDHPRKRNGSYKLDGTIGWVQNFANMEKPAMWRDKHSKPVDRSEMLRNIEKAEKQRKEKQAKAAKKAAWIMHNAKCGHHEYLASKGFPKEKGWVWEGKLVIPMRIGGELVGCQLIEGGTGLKRFLAGQITKGATAGFDTKGRVILCEGYATALSVRAALKYAKIRYNIKVCFSAGNMAEIASSYPDCFVIADHDASGTGQRVAKKTGRPYWLSPIVGEDANDYMNRVGVEEFASVLTEALMEGTGCTLQSAPA